MLKKETDTSKPDEKTVPMPQEENGPRLPSLPTLVVKDSVEEIDYSPPSRYRKSLLIQIIGWLILFSQEKPK